MIKILSHGQKLPHGAVSNPVIILLPRVRSCYRVRWERFREKPGRQPEDDLPPHSIWGSPMERRCLFPLQEINVVELFSLALLTSQQLLLWTNIIIQTKMRRKKTLVNFDKNILIKILCKIFRILRKSIFFKTRRWQRDWESEEFFF